MPKQTKPPGRHEIVAIGASVDYHFFWASLNVVSGMIIFYAWCGFLAFIFLSIPIAAMLGNRPSKPVSHHVDEPMEEAGVVEDVDEGEVIEEAGFVEDEAEMAEEVEEVAEFEEL